MARFLGTRNSIDHLTPMATATSRLKRVRCSFSQWDHLGSAYAKGYIQALLDMIVS